MPEMSFDSRTTNDKSTLTEAWHPAFLVAIVDEATPITWQMYTASPRMWRWQFAIFPDVATLLTTAPERQSAPSSQKFSPGGTKAASKAYLWSCKLLGRTIQPGERVNLDPLMPLPCEVLISRHDKLGQLIEYANITDLRSWPEGQSYVTDGMKAALAALSETPPAAAAAPASSPVRPPALATWSQPAPRTPQPAPVGPAPQGW